MKDLHIRDIDEKIHSDLAKSADRIGVSINSIVKDAIDKWLNSQSTIPKVHDILLYSDEESLSKLLQSVDKLAMQGDFFRSFCGQENKITKQLSKMEWFDGTVYPYLSEKKDILKYFEQVGTKLVKNSSKKPLCCFDFAINDVAKNSLKDALEAEIEYDKNRLSGIIFCVYKTESILAAGIDDMMEIFSKHDQVFLLSQNKLYKLHATEESTHKLFLQ